ncbi:restriction endonuclease subunit S [Nocardia cyriacigeorgica]|uniref:restriction endonuclease subunit S n=1 Tax=Nocardia cyriacigeorgica TaxID=135487 RepID=UPI0024553DA1|nr:restriction endonuclease subunit S [Nocardia cyriacigeorgica]
MSTWPIKELAHVATILRIGINPRDIDGDTKYVGLENIESGGRIINVSAAEAAGIESQKYQFTADHILYGKLRPYLAKIARPNFGGVCSTDILPIEPSPAIDRNYLCHFLSQPSMISKANARATGVNLPRINPAELGKFTVPVPPIAVQRRIAEVLDHVDALREKRRKSIALLDDLAQSIFLDMFGDSHGRHRGWPVRPAGEFLDFLTSGSRGWARYYSDTSDSLFIRIQNVRKDELVLDDIAYVDPPKSAEAERTRVQPGDVLLSITADLGRTAVVPSNIGPAYINQHLAILRTRQVEPQYLSSYIASPSGQTQLLRRNRQGVKAGLNFNDIRSLLIPIPPTSYQKKYVETLAECRDTRARLAESLTHLDTLFSSIQSRAFRGELWQDDLKDL